MSTLFLLFALSILSLSSAFLAPTTLLLNKNAPGISITSESRSSSSSRSTSLFEQDNQQDYIARPGYRPKPQGGDMAYIEKNIQRQMNTYLAIRESGASVDDCVRDVYARAPPQTTCWYIGKVAFTSGTDVTEQQAITRQLNLIEEHATRLRPVELGRAFGRIEICTAPGDSEMLVADDKLALTRMPRYAEGCEDVSLKEAGFFCEVVTNQGIGFGVERDLDGSLLDSS